MMKLLQGLLGSASSVVSTGVSAFLGVSPLQWALYACLIGASLTGGWEARRVWDAPVIAGLQTEVAVTVAKAEKARADLNAKTLAAKGRTDEASDKAASEARMSDADVMTRSDELLKELRDAPESDARPLGPAVKRYLDELRNDAGAAAGNADDAGLPPH